METTGQAAHDVDSNTLVNAALKVAQLVDAGKSSELWDAFSAVAREVVDRQHFVDLIDAQRKPRGAAEERHWTTVHRQSTPGTQAQPGGTYANVEFETRFAGSKVGHELISFRLDEDGYWRPSGYALK